MADIVEHEDFIVIDEAHKTVFSNVARDLVQLGWSVFPQERTGRRLPGTSRHHITNVPTVIEWQSEHHLETQLPQEPFLSRWCEECSTLNVALVFGPASGNTFAIDIDVLDAEMSAAIDALATEMLGYTSFRRVGRVPKLALIYRLAPGDTLPSTSRIFAKLNEAGEPVASEHGIEILSSGKVLTLYGTHHKTGRRFAWLDDQPSVSPPETATLVRSQDVNAFWDAVAARWPFIKRASSLTPQGEAILSGMTWVENADGKISDGRESFMTSLAMRAVRENAHRILATRDNPAQFAPLLAHITRDVMQQFGDNAVLTGRWTPNAAQREASSKVARLAANVTPETASYSRPPANDARMKRPETARPAARTRRRTGFDTGVDAPVQPGTEDAALAAGGDTETPAAAVEFTPSTLTELSFLPHRRTQLSARFVAGDGINRPIPEDRSDITTEVATKLQAALDAFFNERVYGPVLDGDRAGVDILMAPTGAGKTSQTMRYITEDRRTYEPYAYRDEEGNQKVGPLPIIMLLPTYNNIDELRQNAAFLGLDPDMGDRDFAAAAADLGMVPVEQIGIRLADIRRIASSCTLPEGVDALRTMVYAGKIRAGCLLPEAIGLAMEAGIGTSSFCFTQTKSKVTGETEQTFCQHYQECPAIRQRAQIAESHVVFMPHSFLALSIPDELQNVRAVIADERVHHLFLHSTIFPTTALSLPRRPPRLTKREVTDGLNVEDLLQDRDLAATMALDALSRGECPASALLDFAGDAQEKRVSPGSHYVQSALRVCSNALSKEVRITPNMDIADIRQLCAQPSGLYLRDEREFWLIVQDRMHSLQHDRLRDGAIMTTMERLEALLPVGIDPMHDAERAERTIELTRRQASPTHANGATDARIQFVVDMDDKQQLTGEFIRISWRGIPNWNRCPTLLLDASAEPDIIAKVWQLPENRIRAHRVLDDYGAAMNVHIVGLVNRTFSTSSIITDPKATREKRAEAGKLLSQVRDALSTVSALYGDGRVVAGTSIKLRQALNNGWAGPSNVDWCHFGAMRGLDMFKNHTAAFSVGRMEVPTRVIDGIVGALSYDDDEPELPFDLHGDGLDHLENGDIKPRRLPMVPQPIRLRSGQVAMLDIPCYPGKWARMLQKQYREEELSQFVGRLRPVYREGRTPVWFALSSVLPPGLIVDELIDIKDLLRETANLWSAVRGLDGVVEPSLIQAAFPELFATEASAANAMKLAGLDHSTGTLLSRRGRGFSVLRWRTPLRAWSHAFVAACVEDPVALVSGKLAELRGLTEVEVERQQDTAVLRAQTRAPDAVEVGIGTSDERLTKELDRLGDVGALLMNTEQSSAPSAGDGAESFDVFNQRMTIPEISAMLAIEDFWRARQP